MNKILLLVILGMTLFLLMNRQTCISENFSNICWSLQSTYRNDILVQNKKLISDLGLNDYINNIIEPLVKSQSIDKKITLEVYLTSKKVPLNKLSNVIKLINIILNNNCMISELIEYDIKATTPLVNIVNTWHIDNLRNSMICVINDKKVIDMLIKQMVITILSPKIELCSKDKFQQYCEKSYEKYVKEITPKVKVISEVNSEIKAEVINKKELETVAKDLNKAKIDLQSGSSMQITNSESKFLPIISNSPKYMDINSMSKYLETFNAKSLGNDLEQNMIKLMGIFKTNNKKEFNLMDKKDFGIFVGILVDEIKLSVKKIIDENDLSMLKPLIVDLVNYQKIFYLLKHNYKLLLVLELINQKIKKDDEKLQAQLCCSKTNEKSCFNFSTDPKNSSAIVYGFNELGYVNSVKCIKEDESSKKLDREQSMTLDELFNSKYELWKNINRENKTTILASIINLVNIHGVKLETIDGKISDIRKQFEDNNNKITPSDLELTIPSKPSNINRNFIINNNYYRNIIQQLKKADKINKIQEIIINIGFTSSQIYFNDNVNITYAKDITEALILVKEVMKNFGYSNNSIVIAKIFGIIKTSETFAEIMTSTTISPRYHQIIIDFILKTIINKKFAAVRTYSMNSIPNTIIQYLQSMPNNKDLKLCNIYNDFLAQLRKDRIITNSDFIQYNQQIELYCKPK